MSSQARRVRNAGSGKCHPTGPQLKPQLRWQWGHTDLLPNRPIVVYDYVLSEQNPIAAAVRNYARCDHRDRFDMHDALECGFVLEGRVIRYWGSTRQKRICGPGSVWFCPSYEPNGYRLNRTPCQLVVFEIRPQLVASLGFAQAPQIDWLQPFTAPWQARPRRVRKLSDLQDLARRLDRVLRGRETQRRLQVQFLLMEFLAMVVGRQTRRSADKRLPSETPGRLRPALELVLRSRRRIGNEEGARVCAMSSDRFARVFRRAMGLSFARFDLRHRLQGAASEIASSSVPLKAIATDWGFADESHLARLFARHLHCTPSAYRERAHAKRVRPQHGPRRAPSTR